MAQAPLGDDVFGDDPTVNALEAATADRLGKEAGLFVSSGTQSNLCAILAHCQRGDAYVVGQQAHAYRYEAGGAAVLGSIQPQPHLLDEFGAFDLDQLGSHIVTDSHLDHFAVTSLLCLENTHDGKVLDAAYVAAAQETAREAGVALHLDGARLWHAAVATGREPAEIAAGFDTVSACFSKGLGAPVGSVLCGSLKLITEARRWRKMLGGGMRQAGIIASAALYALDNHVERLAQDHKNAARLGEGLREIGGVEVVSVNTNMVFLNARASDHEKVSSALLKADVTAFVEDDIRLVTHLGISADDIETVIDAFRLGAR